uniref:Uncharacterized protein n=1 Tax=Siphoviridae sp. ctEeW6 TaxID=2827816 RepID=A0A8S5T1Y1_9CAUD|nr:MAG TPA: hypothetical protein [Siphoviridae sp. ctEeW6]
MTFILVITKIHPLRLRTSKTEIPLREQREILKRKEVMQNG